MSPSSAPLLAACFCSFCRASLICRSRLQERLLLSHPGQLRACDLLCSLSRQGRARASVAALTSASLCRIGLPALARLLHSLERRPVGSESLLLQQKCYRALGPRDNTRAKRGLGRAIAVLLRLLLLLLLRSSTTTT